MASKKPKGLTITRKKNKYILAWKKGETYGDGQRLIWGYTQVTKNGNKSSKTKWESSTVKLGASKSNYTVTIPSTYTDIANVYFKVRGKADNKEWSAWEDETFTIKAPKLPTVTASWDSATPNKTTFSYTAKDEDHQPYDHCVYQRILVPNCPDDYTVESLWKNATPTNLNGTSGTFATDAESALTGTNARIVRVKAVGVGGSSEWRYAYHVYAAPNAATGVKVSAEYNTGEGAFDLSVEWDIMKPKMQRPVDTTTVQYVIGVPTAGLGLPTGASWTDLDTPVSTDLNLWQGKLADSLDPDECLFIRVQTQHDSNKAWSDFAVFTGKLAQPSSVSTTPNSGTHTIAVSWTNASTVPDSKTAVLYRDPATGVVGCLSVAAHGTASASVVVPTWTDNPGDIGVYAFVGTSTLAQTTSEGVTIYNVVADMISDTKWAGTPKAPTIGVTLVDAETARVTWSWPWSDATNAEISWADRPDAWESTNQPQTYDVPNYHAAQWNICDLESGKTYYFRVRLFYGEGDDEVYGEYSNTVSLDLSAAPEKPVLTLSENIITADGSLTASWLYQSNDGTKMAYAEIAEKNGATYTVIGSSDVSSLELSAEEMGWTIGNQYDLAVRVYSESGRQSAWSDVETVTIAEPLDCVIAQDSLVYDDIIINPETVTGNPATFDSGSDNVKEITSVEVPLTPTQAGTPWQDSNLYQTPYLFRKTPQVNHSINSKYTTLVGADVAVNEWVEDQDFTAMTRWGIGPNATSSVTGDVLTAVKKNASPTGNQYVNYTGSKSLPNNHVIMIVANLASHSSSVAIQAIQSSPWTNLGTKVIDVTTTLTQKIILMKPTTGNMSSLIFNFDNKEDISIQKPYVTDLTAYYGSSAIADYAYTLESQTAGSGIAWLKSQGFDFSKFIAQNTGSLESVNPSAIVTRGFNQWDEEWEVGTYDVNTGLPNGVSQIRSKNRIKVMPSTEYCFSCASITNLYVLYYDANDTYLSGGRYTSWDSIYRNDIFTTPSYCGYIRFYLAASYGNTYNNDICVNISKTTGTPKNGDYRQYSENEYALGNVPLHGVFKLVDGNIQAFGDVRTGDGTKTSNWKILHCATDAFSLTKNDGDSTHYLYYINRNDGRTETETTAKRADVIANKYFVASTSVSVNGVFIAYSDTYHVIYVGVEGLVQTNTEEVVKQFLINNAVDILYPTNPTTTTADSFTNPQVVDADGTEEFVDTRAVAIPVGNQTRYADVYEITGTSSVDTHVRGHNQWDEEWELGSYDTTTGEPVSGSLTIRCKNYIPVLPSTTYRYIAPTGGNGVWFEYDGNKNFIVAKGLNAGGYNITVSDNCRYVRFRVASNYGTTYNNDISINYPSTATSYEPYAGSDTTTALGQTVYEGTVDVVKGKLTVNMAEVDLGSLTWTYSSGAFRTTVPDMEYPTVSTIPADMICSIYETKAWAEGADNDIMAFHWGSTYQVAVIDSAYTDIAEFKSHVTGAQLVYLLAEPIEIDLTPTEIEALLGDNYVWSEQGTVTVKIADAVESGYFLDELPLTVTVTGAGNEGDTTMKIVRAENYAMERPDGKDYNGYEGDLIVARNQAGEDQMTIDLSDLVGRFDDGAKYRIIATTQDQFGQSAEATKDFVVRWSHQAVIATGTAVIDGDIAKITPTKPDGALDSDMVDIYRLSADAPVLIYEGAEFGVTYVDPYPTIGETGGYRLVLRTKNGDYITANDIPSWTDYTAGLDTMFQYIDFDGNRLPLKYNVEIDESAEKIMEVTQYLGGATQGDSLEGYKGNGTVNGVIPYDLDPADYLLLRELKRYAGICHVRTKTGSNYTAFVTVNDSAAYNSPGHVHNVGLTIQQFDNPVLDGVTLTDWQVS